MSSGPSVLSDTRERQRGACASLADDIDGVLKTFSTGVDDVAVKHGRTAGYVRSLAGIASTKAPKGSTTAFGAFCGRKLEEANNGKEKGTMITLPTFLKLHSSELKTEFSALSNEEKQVLLASYLEAKDEKENTPLRASNVAISKAVDSKMQRITAMCEDLNRMYQTETLVLFCRGNLAHSYSCGSFATEGAQNWLENSDIGHSELNLAAMQMEAFTVSGCNKRVKILKEGSAKLAHWKVQSECQNTIQAGLKSILGAKKYHKPNTQMNYVHYERLIVERLGVAIAGWPLGGRICNPGTLTSDDALVLRNALANKTCKWVRLTAQQLEDRKARNMQCAANGEDVYGPPRKKRAKKTGSTASERNVDGDNGEIEDDGESLERDGMEV